LATKEWVKIEIGNDAALIKSNIDNT